MSSTSPTIRSLRSDLMSLVTFISRTRRQVAIYWVDFLGRRVRYGVLNYGEHFPLTTYETHPWIFRDNNTGDVLVTSQGHEIFMPRPWDGGNQDTVIIGIPGWLCVNFMRGASAAENSAAENTKTMLSSRKYCSNDDTNPNINSKRP